MKYLDQGADKELGLALARGAQQRGDGTLPPPRRALTLLQRHAPQRRKHRRHRQRRRAVEGRLQTANELHISGHTSLSH